MMTSNHVLFCFVVVYLLQMGFSYYIEMLNEKYISKNSIVPLVFQEVVSKEKLDEINSYNLDTGRLGRIESLTSDIVFLIIVLSGMTTAFDMMHNSSHYVIAGVSFILSLGFPLYILELPFGYYKTFVIEEKYNFNKSTVSVWVSDHLKEGVLSILFMFLLLSPIFWLIRNFQNWWWLIGFLVVSSIQIVLTILYPVLIAPLFNKFEPLKDKELAEKVKMHMDKAGIEIKEILQMDAGKRSKHTNAYFTGLGKTKRIVFYDTLLESHTHDEILAILAHEAGHCIEKHIVKQLAVFEISMLAMFYFTYVMINWKLVPLAFGFGDTQPYIGLIIVTAFWEKAAYFLKPLYMALSRRFEYEADSFSLKIMKTSTPMVNSLKRIAADNLSNLNPHPLYVSFYYSHPPIAERVAALEKDCDC